MVSYSELFQYSIVIFTAMTFAVFIITNVNNKKK